MRWGDGEGDGTRGGFDGGIELRESIEREMGIEFLFGGLRGKRLESVNYVESVHFVSSREGLAR